MEEKFLNQHSLENMDCKTPMGIPHTVFKISKNPTPGRKNSLPISLQFLMKLFCEICEEEAVLSRILDLVFGIVGTKSTTNKILRNEPDAAKSEALCSLKLEVTKPPREGPTTIPIP